MFNIKNLKLVISTNFWEKRF